MKDGFLWAQKSRVKLVQFFIYVGGLQLAKQQWLVMFPSDPKARKDSYKRRPRELENPELVKFQL